VLISRLASGAHGAHRLVVRVKRLFGENFCARLIFGSTDQQRPEAHTLKPVRHRQTEAFQQTWRDINVADQLTNDPPAGHASSWPTPQQRDFDAWIVQRTFRAGHRRAVVGCEHDARLIGYPEVVQRLEQAPDTRVHLPNRTLKRGEIAARFRHIRQVRRHRNSARQIGLCPAKGVWAVRLLKADFQVKRAVLTCKLGEQTSSRRSLRVGRLHRQHVTVPQLTRGAALDQVLHADQGRAVASICENLGHMTLAWIEPPTIGRVRQAHHSRAVRVSAGVQRRTARTALRGGAKAAVETNTAGRQRVQGRRRDRRLPVTPQMLAQVVAGEKENGVTRQQLTAHQLASPR
jgi:hypothetical protein